MNNRPSIYEKILRDYDDKRTNSKVNLREKQENIYKEIPLIADIDRQIRMTAIRSGKSILKGEELDYTRELEDLEAAKIAQLLLHGYPENYLEPTFECDKCKDTGFIGSSECTCLTQAVVKEYYKMSNLDKVLERENFSTFDIDLFSEEIDEDLDISPKSLIIDIYNTSKKFIQNFEEEEERNLLFFGKTGLGKTFMVNCIAKELMDLGYTVIYQTAPNLLDIIEEYRFSKTDNILESKKKYEFLIEADLLIIDDLGSENSNSYTNSEIFKILNTRNLGRKKMIISTNLTPGEISRTYTDRIYSRILDRFDNYIFIGKDLRWERL